MSAVVVPRRRVLVLVPLLLVSLLTWWATRADSEASPPAARAASTAQAGKIAFASLPGGVQATLPVLSFRAGGVNTSAPAGSGGGTGKFVPDDPTGGVDANDVDPPLLRAGTTGVHIAPAPLTLYRPGTTKKQEVWQLADVTISELRTAQSGSTKPPRLTLGLRYTRVAVTSFTAGGTAAGTYCFDLATSTSC